MKQRSRVWCRGRRGLGPRRLSRNRWADAELRTVEETPMSSDRNLLRAAKELVEAVQAAREVVDGLNKVVDENLPHEIAEIVKAHSAGAAAAGVAAGWLPGAGGIAAVGI